MSSGSSLIFFDGSRLTTDRRLGGRRFRIDPRCLFGERVGGVYANVCSGLAIRFDEPEIQQARRDVLAWWLPLLGGELVCFTTLVLDESRCGGAITVATSPDLFEDDPFARIFPATIVETDLFARVPPPTGPAIERYSGLAWPGGAFRNR
ncbi:MAG TPA: hypothetical protein VF101_08300 [Gaiellaceae bacterium]